MQEWIFPNLVVIWLLILVVVLLILLFYLLGGIVNSASIRIAGNAFDNDIVKYIKDKYKLLVGERTAEDIKITIGTVFPGQGMKRWRLGEEI